MLEVRNLCKSFGAIDVTKDVCFKLEPGERRVVLGPNGAGKTTLFNLLVGELRPTSGDILLNDQSIQSLSVSQRAAAGISRSYQKNNLFETLTIGENLALAAAAGLSKTSSLIDDFFHNPEVQETVRETAQQVGLSELLNAQVSSASYGNRRQLEVALALATRPSVILMDEPTSGVGPNMIKDFHRLMANLPRDLTMIIIEHDLDLAFDLADRITVLNYGEVVFEGTPEETRGNQTVRNIYLGDWEADA